jgi:chromatin remodeling complex protein RSC6
MAAKGKSGLTKPMKLSSELADVVGKKEASRAECIKFLWVYIKKNNLQDPENKQFFKPDKKMAKVLLICLSRILFYLFGLFHGLKEAFVL